MTLETTVFSPQKYELRSPSVPDTFSENVSGSVMKALFAPARDEPVVTSLLDTDFYKFPMNQLERQWMSPADQEKYGGLETWGKADVTFSWINRHRDVIKPHEYIDIEELRAHLNAARDLQFTPAELAYLRGMPINPQNTKRMFSGWFIRELEDYKLPDFDLGTEADGSFKLDFHGSWEEVTFWEIICMSTIMELYLYNVLKKEDIDESGVMEVVDEMQRRLDEMILKIGKDPRISVAEFGTRRRFSKSWQNYAYARAKDELGDQNPGSSNVKMSMDLGSNNPIGTNAHELPMVVANLGDDSDEYIKDSQYEVLRRWRAMYPELLVYLPDTFGTKQFHNQAPADLELEKWAGPRIDSMPETEATDFMLDWWETKGVDPIKDGKLLMPSDGLDPDRLQENVLYMVDKVARLPQAMGTNFVNASKGVLENVPEFRPFSQVCKVTEANGRSAIKLSDNPEKAIGTPERVARFKDLFGTEGHVSQTVEV